MINHFHLFPPGLDITNLHEVQKEFIVYLVGGGATGEQVRLMVRYLQEEKTITEHNYEKEIMRETNPHILARQAEAKGVKLHELITQKAKKRRNDSLAKLKIEYYSDDTPKESGSELQKHAQELERVSTLLGTDIALHE